jgi:hypothetical protein
LKTDFFTTKLATLKGTRVSLVNQFKITLRDFLPDPSDGMVIIDRARFTSTTVSNRLYAELSAYADANKLPLGDVVAQLSEEIQRKPGAIKFAKGDRVKLSWMGVQLMPRMDADRSGTIAFTPREGEWVAVHWDGTQRQRYIDPDLLDRSND